jgi:antitoxin ParD1/3/4
MSKVEKLSIALPPEMLAEVRQAVEAGEYASTSEVVRDALRGWSERRALAGYSVEELRALWNAGIASGPRQPGPPIMKRLREKIANKRTTRPSAA